ncbi:restriction endonuclease subunit S [Streptomyces gibsoniae]|uniref:Restriction endonuclease subunit S n=1 Tax=Streptomyces gibsoniae TaxID=3075529 RepID=A0ABU2TRK4_9ACTN|nr:restriction endonuclease subunit S [Streptomyces sp. DSM 41699]MDT0463497.1 restriction endonuclease subunit S [Streptomyces sp. DSM 41699]
MTTADSTHPDAACGEPQPPEGWQRPLLGDLCASIQAGPGLAGRESGRTATADGVPLVLPRDLSGQRIVSPEPAVVPWSAARTPERYLLAEGDILITRTGTVGRCALVTPDQSGWLYHPNLVRLRLRPQEAGSRGARAAYVTAYLSSEAAQDWIRARAAVAVIPSVSARTLGELPVLLPPPAEQETIGATLAALDDKVRAHTEIARATGEYRAALTEALMSGALAAGP